MLVRFVASNFLSLKEEVEFNMLTGDFETHKHHVYQAGKVEVLKAAAIYGANGAGKSNLVKAISFLQDLVSRGAVTTSVNSKKFKLDPNYQKEPVSLEIEFFTDGKLYSYSVVIDSKAVLEEGLYELRIAREDRLIFERKIDSSGKLELTFAKEYRETQKQQLLIELLQENLLEEDQLLLGKDKELQIDEIEAAQGWIKYGYRVMSSTVEDESVTMEVLASGTMETFANEMLRTFNTGIDSINLEESELNSFSGMDDELKQRIIQTIDDREGHYTRASTKEGSVYVVYKDGKYVIQKLILNHNGPSQSVPFYLSEESDGTRRLLDFISPIYVVKNVPATIIVDEIEKSIHPSLLKALLQKIMNDETTKGQLIFTTHESNLLDLKIFRQDEIWFAEKGRKTGATEFYSLSEFKPGYGSDIEKGYLNGRFGAIPFLGNLEELNWHSYAEKE